MSVEVGQPAPAFELSNQFGETVALEQFRGVKPVVLVFFPLAFTGVCTGEMCELRDNFEQFRDAGVELLTVSVDSTATLRTFAEKEGYEFSMLSDFWPHGAVAQQYGAFLESKGIASRHTFLIDTEGIVSAHFFTEPGEPRNFDEYRAALAQLAA